MKKQISEGAVDRMSCLFEELADKNTLAITTRLVGQSRTYEELFVQTKMEHEDLAGKLYDLMQKQIIRTDGADSFVLYDAIVLNIVKLGIEKAEYMANREFCC